MGKEIALTKGYAAVVDDEDFERLAKFSWHAHPTKTKVYARRRDGHAGPAFYMHREVLGLGSEELIDHADGNGLNNTRSNLRICTQRENMANRVAKRGCSSKYKGVHFYKRDGTWAVTVDSKFWGYHKTEDMAGLVYNFVAAQIYGKFALLNEVPCGR